MAAHQLAREIEQLRVTGVASLQDLARALTVKGVPAPRAGQSWTHPTVARVLGRVPHKGP